MLYTSLHPEIHPIALIPPRCSIRLWRVIQIALLQLYRLQTRQHIGCIHNSSVAYRLCITEARFEVVEIIKYWKQKLQTFIKTISNMGEPEDQVLCLRRWNLSNSWTVFPEPWEDAFHNLQHLASQVFQHQHKLTSRRWQIVNSFAPGRCIYILLLCDLRRIFQSFLTPLH